MTHAHISPGEICPSCRAKLEHLLAAWKMVKAMQEGEPVGGDFSSTVVARLAVYGAAACDVMASFGHHAFPIVYKGHRIFFDETVVGAPLCISPEN